MKRLSGATAIMLLLAIGIGLPRVAASGAQAQAPQRPGTYPADFGLVLDMQAARKFTANDIQSFVHHVFSMYERATSATRRVGPDAFRPFLDDNVKIDFPDYKIRNWQEFVTWHHWIHDRLVGDDHVLGPIDVHFLSDGRYQAHFVVLWRALFKSGEYNEVRVEQTWTLREQADRDAPVIEEYAAKVADFRARD